MAELNNSGVLRLVLAFGELFDHLFLESRDVVRLAACHESLVGYDLLISPFAARVMNIRLKRGPGSKFSAAHDVGFDQHPRAVTDGGDRFVRLEKSFDELHRR